MVCLHVIVPCFKNERELGDKLHIYVKKPFLVLTFGHLAHDLDIEHTIYHILYECMEQGQSINQHNYLTTFHISLPSATCYIETLSSNRVKYIISFSSNILLKLTTYFLSVVCYPLLQGITCIIDALVVTGFPKMVYRGLENI